jgi:hypothetical protein
LEGETSMTGMLALEISIFEYAKWRLAEFLVIMDLKSVLMLTRKDVRVVRCGRLSGCMSPLLHTTSAPP